MAGEVVGGPPKFQQASAFGTEIEGIEVAKFTTANIPKQTAAIILQREGGSILPVDVATGIVTIEPVTLSRGKTDNSDLYDWWQNVLLGIQDQRLVTIVEKDTAGNAITRWPLGTCALASYDGGAFDATKGENVVESITLQPLNVGREKAA